MANTTNTPQAANVPTSFPHDEVVVILDFGSQTAQLIARRIREAGAYSVLLAPTVTAEQLRILNPKGIILSGGPSSVYESTAPRCDPNILKLGIPVLGICYGMQLACQFMGFKVERAESREFGRAGLHIKDRTDLFGAIPEKTAVWMSHGDQVQLESSGGSAHPTGSPNGPIHNPTIDILASTETCPLAAIRICTPELTFYGVQFHPEVTHTPHGVDILRNFLYEVCKCTGSWKMSDFLETEIMRVREKVGPAAAGRSVICGLSGGVDSSVCAALLHKAIGPQLHCIFIDTGLLRKNERELVETTFRDHFKIKLTVIDAGDQFLADLKDISDPQEKRKRIGARFIRVFEKAQQDLGGDARNYMLAQGTLYPDVIESGHGHAGQSANIKLHHNVGGLPEDMLFTLIEPLRDLFKDEVRKLGEVLGLPDQIIWRHPFPGPGLAVRILGQITKEKLDLLRDADEILLEEIVANNLYRSTSQVFAVLLNVKSVGVMGDGRTYESCIAIRAVETQDFMSADWARIPFSVLANISSRIINEVRGVNRVVYDISSKPPATIEWE